MSCCRFTWPLILSGLSVVLFVACDKRAETKDATASKSSFSKDSIPQIADKSTLDKADPMPVKVSSTRQAATAPLEGESLLLTGLAMTTPLGWLREKITPGAMKPVAIFKLPPANGDVEPASVRFTYFPNMKGMDQANIDRWIGQVRQPSGQPSTREQATIDVIDLGSVRITKVDILGTVDSSMGNGGKGANQRLIAAIIDHPRGPHFVRIYGGVATMDKWAPSIRRFLASAIVR